MGHIEIVESGVPNAFVGSAEPRIEDLRIGVFLNTVYPIQNEYPSKVVLVDWEEIRDDQNVWCPTFTQRFKDLVA